MGEKLGKITEVAGRVTGDREVEANVDSRPHGGGNSGSAGWLDTAQLRD